MAKTPERKLEVAKRITELACDEHGLDREALIFDALTFTLTTGDDEWKPSAVATIDGIRAIKKELPGVKTFAGRVERLVRRVARRPRGAELGLPAPLRRGGVDLAMVNPTIIPLRDLGGGARARRRPRLQPARTPSNASPRTSSRRARRRTTRRDPTEGMEPEALHFMILRARRRASRTGSTARSRRSARSRR